MKETTYKNKNMFVCTKIDKIELKGVMPSSIYIST